MIGIIDYKMGNIGSLCNALEFCNLEFIVTNNSEEIMSCDKLILPGVGAYRDAIYNLRKYNLIPVIIEFAKKNRPILGICLGYQLLFSKSFENGIYDGLGLINGEIKLLEIKQLKVPHIGWNSIRFVYKSPLFKDLADNSFVYFAHSYCFFDTKSSDVSSITEYGRKFVSSIRKNNIYGVQFHPEKSGEVGLKILKNFGEIA